MVRTARSSQVRKGTKIKAWREYRGLTLERLAAEITDAPDSGTSTTHATLSRLERGLIPYSQDLLEAISRVLRCQPADLIDHDPHEPASVWRLWEQATAGQRHLIRHLASVIVEERVDYVRPAPRSSHIGIDAPPAPARRVAEDTAEFQHAKPKRRRRSPPPAP
jgi:transcriptional regulator with XRE-family HTH domain